MIARRDIDSLTVDLAGNWRLYTNRLPAGARALGVVNSRGASGALAQTTAGVYVRLNLPMAKARGF